VNVVTTIAECREIRKNLGYLALVPTMGALHAGHLSLIEHARDKADKVAVSIFVNPTQFGPREDFQSYPRPIADDLAKCEAAGVDLVFNPTPEEIYPPKGDPAEQTAAEVFIDMPNLSNVLEGRFRPTHFRGVCQVVAKLFNILYPQVACFGQKDYQQLRVLTAMVDALNFQVEIVGCPTLRDPDGLAMSSRNQYLSDAERQRALSINRGLFAAQEEYSKGFRQTNRLMTTVQKIMLEAANQGRVPLLIDYVAAVDAMTLKNVLEIERKTLIAVAARIGPTRLIDNVLLGGD